MNPDLLGYVLNVLKPEERRSVERHLESSPEARKRLEGLRRMLRPLGYDREDAGPAKDLVVNTLKRVARYRTKRVGPPAPPVIDRPVVRSRWRRPDVLVAASIALLILAMIPPGVMYLRRHSQVVACADNLRLFHAAFEQYAERHGGDLPGPDQEGPLAFAGVYPSRLRDDGCWQGPMQVVCPANRRGAGPCVLPSLEEVKSKNCQVMRTSLGGCYGYNLGYLDEKTGQFRTVSRKVGDDMPIMADRPPRPTNSKEQKTWQTANSPNHGGCGQNVLYLGGHVRYECKRTLGGDDIFLNTLGRVAAGRGPRDAVLAFSEASPCPPRVEE